MSTGGWKPSGWEAKTSLREGIAQTYPWIKAQVDAARAKKAPGAS
jgi:hypothetical protein